MQYYLENCKLKNEAYITNSKSIKNFWQMSVVGGDDIRGLHELEVCKGQNLQGLKLPGNFKFEISRLIFNILKIFMCIE